MLAAQERLAQSRAAVLRFVQDRFPDEARYFAPVWDATLRWLGSSSMPCTPGDRSAAPPTPLEGLGMVGGPTANLRVQAVVSAIAGATHDVYSRQISVGAREAAGLVEARARAFPALREGDVTALGLLFTRLMLSDAPKHDYEVIERLPNQSPQRRFTSDPNDLVGVRARREHFRIFLDDVQGELFAWGSICPGMRPDRQHYRLLLHLLRHAPEEVRYSDAILTIALRQHAHLHNAGLAEAVLKCWYAARDAMSAACGDSEVASWVVARAGKICLAANVGFCLLTRAVDP